MLTSTTARCTNGHSIRPGHDFCTRCGSPRPANTEPRARSRWRWAVTGLAMAVAGGVIGALLLTNRDTPTQSQQPDATEPPATAEQTPPPASSTPTTTTTTVAPTSSTMPPSAASADSATARSAAVVAFTHGVEAEGYGPIDTLVAPDALPGVLTSVISADYRDASCTQIVETVSSPTGTSPTYEFDLTLAMQCLDTPTSSFDGSELPLTRYEHVALTMERNPAGNYWATDLVLIDQD